MSLSPLIPAGWIKRISRFASVQSIVQLLNVACGILIIRMLTKEEYAWYAIGTSMLAGINVLSNSGINSGLIALCGKLHHDRQELSNAMRTATHLRVRLAVIASACIAPISLWLLVKNGADYTTAALATTLVIAVAVVSLTNALFRVPACILNRTDLLQKGDVGVAIGRLLLLGICVWIGFGILQGFAIMFATVVAANVYLRFSMSKELPASLAVSKEYSNYLLQNFREILPLNLFSMFQSQAVILLLSVFGTTANVATVAALSRLSVIFSIIQDTTANLLIPRFAKCHEPRKLLGIYFKILAFVSALGAIPVCLVAIFPDAFLALLGPQYAGLKVELLIILGGAAISLISATLKQLSQSRGWVRHSWVYIPVTLVWVVPLAWFLPLGETVGAATFAALIPLTTMLMGIWRAWAGFHSMFNGADSRDFNKL